jgi:hypothetical protein
MIDPQIDLDALDPNLVDLAFDVRYLAREMTVTVRVNDDKLFKLLSVEGQKVFDHVAAELALFKKHYNQQKP